MGKIKCTVSECHFNKNMICGASAIQVNHNGASHSQQSDDTQCETFRPKDV